MTNTPDKKLPTNIQKRLENLDDIIKVQCSKGNYDVNDYMLGMANGLLCARSLFDDKEPEYLSVKRTIPNNAELVAELLDAIDVGHKCNPTDLYCGCPITRAREYLLHQKGIFPRAAGKALSPQGNKMGGGK